MSYNSPGNYDDDNERHPLPATDAFGLPIYMDQAQTVTTMSDGPIGEGSHMRSIGIAPPSFGNAFDSSLLAPPTLMSQTSLGGMCGDFGGFSLEPPTLKEQVSLSLTESPFGVGFKEMTSSLTVTAMTWIIPEGSLKPVPEFYPLEQSAVFVEGDIPADIAARISDCFRYRSIAVTYSDKKPKAKCKTMDGVEFVVMMYYGRGDYNHGVIVEVQRRSGWTPSFQQDLFAILETAENVEVNDFDMSIPPMDDLLNDDEEDEFEFSSFEKASNPVPRNLVLSDNVDVKTMGMQILTSVTDLTKVGSKTALKNASRIIHGTQEVEIKQTLMNMIVNDDSSDDYGSSCREMALKVMGNCVEVMMKENVLGMCLFEERWVLDKIIPSLVKELHAAGDSPNEAAVAAKCLGNLMKASPEARQKALNLGALSALSKAKDVGTSMHCVLEKESSRGVTILECF